MSNNFWTTGGNVPAKKSTTAKKVAPKTTTAKKVTPTKKTATHKMGVLTSKLAAQIGGTTLDQLNQRQYYVDTGNLALNYICSGKFIGGGYPGGKIIEVYGPPATSKSLLGYTALGNCQQMGGIAVLLDSERAANPQFIESAGHCNLNELVHAEPFFIEEVEAKICSVIRYVREHVDPDIPLFFVWDSIGVSPCKREWKETELPENYTEAEFKRIVGAHQQPGERAKRAGELLRKVCPLLSENNATLYVINQTREKIGVMFGSPETTAGGGKALEFYASTRLRTSAQKAIEHTKLKVPMGVNLKFQNKKSRSFTPFLHSDGIQLYFAQGINPLGGLLSVLMNAGRVEMVSKGNYKILPEWTTTGEDYTFKASGTRNDIDQQTLIENPKVIDADSAADVVDYLGVFAEAIDLSTSDETTEKEMSDDEATRIAQTLGLLGEDEE